ncbi:MAG: stage II sporulation protein D [Eubacteriales bacterium]|nr:stage II sporulation protein D [Eubacteriales bacterium]
MARLKIILTSAVLASAILIGGVFLSVPKGKTEPVGAARRTESPEGGLVVFDVSAGRCVRMETEEYVFGCVAAEMPALFALEALKAQAVACRTYAVAKGRCPSHPEADVCTDSQCCQCYASAEELRRKWGGGFEEYSARIAEAVRATAGELVLYDGNPALTLYHSNSVGFTADCVTVFGSSEPYLISVDSPSDAGAEHYATQKSFSLSSFVDTVNAAYPAAGLTTRSVKREAFVAERSADGRVKKLVLGGVNLDGAHARSLFGLRSADFVLTFSGEVAVFDVKGSGHGVGMSQVGANVLAKQGWSYREILTHYYPGTCIGTTAETGV